MRQLALIGILLIALTGCGVEPEDKRERTMAEPTPMTDFRTLRRPGSPNNHLILPDPAANFAIAAEGDEIASTFNVPAIALVGAWRRVIEGEPRATLIGVSEDGLQVEAQEKTAVLGFVDLVSFRAVPIGEERSTFAAYSRSQVGYWDISANKRRLGRWVEALRTAVADRS